jgi:uncharacterized protein (DUF2267 family)
MTTYGTEAIDATMHKTNEWLREIGSELGEEHRRHAYLTLRGTLHAIRDFLPTEESAQFSAQLPMLMRGIYFEGWNPSRTPEKERTRESFVRRTAQALERAQWNEEFPIDPEEATRAVLRVIAGHISAGEMEQVRQTMPERVRVLWPEPSAIRAMPFGE